MKLLPLLLILCVASCSVQATPDTLSKKGWDQQINGVLPEKWRSLDRVKLNETTLDEIETFYGEGVRVRKEGKEGSPFFLCYAVGHEHIVIFESGPLGGWSTVTGIMVAEKGKYDNKNCGGSIKIPLGVAELRIGNEERNVYDALGKPSFKTQEGIVYRYHHKAVSKRSKNQVIDVTSGIEVGLHEGWVNWIYIYWLEST